MLVVEDDEDIRYATSRFLSGLGVRVRTAEHGERALSAALEAAPHLVLCDLTMPVMDGFAFVQEFRSRAEWASIPVVAVSALPPETAAIETRNAGFDGFVPKPIDLDALVVRLTAIRQATQQAASSAAAATLRAEEARRRAIAAAEDAVRRWQRALRNR